MATQAWGPPVSFSAMDTPSEPPTSSDRVIVDASPASYCVPVCSAPGPDPVTPVPVTVTALATVSTAPVSVTVPASAASAPATYPVGTPVPTEGPFPFPELAGDPEAIDRRLIEITSRELLLLK